MERLLVHGEDYDPGFDRIYRIGLDNNPILSVRTVSNLPLLTYLNSLDEGVGNPTIITVNSRSKNIRRLFGGAPGAYTRQFFTDGYIAGISYFGGLDIHEFPEPTYVAWITDKIFEQKITPFFLQTTMGLGQLRTVASSIPTNNLTFIARPYRR